MAEIACSDRDAFGHWLSGFVDGEGTFRLFVHHVTRKTKAGDVRRYATPHALFTITLRADDCPVLEQIQHYLGVGSLYCTRERANSSTKKAVRFVVNSIRDIVDVIIPHFDRFPLRAKKARDFTIWRRGALLIAEIPPPQNKEGRAPIKWTESRVSEFNQLVEEMKSGRRFIDPGLPATIIKGTRVCRGENTYMVKVTPDTVRAIRTRYATGKVSLRALAAEYGLSFSALYDIVRRRNWKHIEDQDA